MLIEYSLRLKRIKLLYNISMLIVGFDSFSGVHVGVLQDDCRDSNNR